MKYVLIIIMTLFSVYPLSESVTDGVNIKRWWLGKPWKRPGVWFAVLLAAATLRCTWKDESDAEVKNNELQHMLTRAETQRERLDTRIAEANDQIKSQSKLLLVQEQTMSEQSRVMGSIAFNTHTSFEGKQRFLNCFRNLARLAKFNVDGTNFEGLICEDGVAVYWFNASTENLMGFHFFPNSELNRILAGIPDDTQIVSSNGNIQTSDKSVLGIAIRESLYRKTPVQGRTQLEKDVSYSCIEEELKLLFRYVYRAEFVKFSDLRFENGDLTGDKDLVFQYYVNPYAAEPRLRTVSDIIVRAEFLDSLYGIYMSEFSQIVIERFRAMGIEPKVGIKDIHVINQKAIASHQRACFPFGKHEGGQEE